MGIGSLSFRSRTVAIGVMALVLLLSLVGFAMAGILPPGGTFFDDDRSVHEGAVEAIASAGITRGCNPPQNTNYCPKAYVTRGQMAAFLVRALGYSAGAGDDLFVDDDGSAFEADIDRLGTAGVTRGCNPPENDRFCPEDRVTREQMASFLARALSLEVATPMPRVDTTDGLRLDMLNIAADQGCGAAIDTFTDGILDECFATVSLFSQDAFFVEHGWFLEGWSVSTPEERDGFISEDTNFQLLLNGTQLDMFNSFDWDQASDVATNTFAFQFYPGMSGTHRIVGLWVSEGVPEIRVTVDVAFVP